jgi:acetyl-CoA synthetase
MDRHAIGSYDELLSRSEDVEWFWNAALDDLGIEFYRPYDRVIDLSEGIELPTWCIGGEMNVVHNCLDKWQTPSHRDRIALKWLDESDNFIQLSYKDLNDAVCQCANALSERGIGVGDAVGLFMPMIVEVCVAFFSVIKVGGVVLPLFSGYGPSAIMTRLRDAEAKAVITCDGFERRGKVVSMKATLDAALQECPGVEVVIVHARVGAPLKTPMTPERDVWWHEVVPRQPTSAPTIRTSAEDVLMIIYTSGTTGRPKGAVHTHCGFPIKAAQDMFHSMDLKPGETMYWMSDMGWMMGPWLLFGTTIIGGTMVLYDGAADYPDAGRLWDVVEQLNVTHLGVSPVLIRALKSHGRAPVDRWDVSSLRIVGSTGSPWDPESWLWLFHTVLGGEKPILNYSGGTEISGGILCGNLFKPLKPCAFSGPVVGMAADVVDSGGRPVRGGVGELVIRKPWIGMTRGFWRDKERYLETYWRRFEGIWVHGDYAAIDDDGLWYILGRSDDTIKIAGKRLGPAEVEALLNADPRVVESAAIGVPDPKKEEVLVAFAVLAEDVEPSDILRDELVSRVTSALGKPLRPREIRFVRALPKTRNAKVMRRLIRSVFLGLETGDTSSLEDPSTMDAIRNSA